MKTALLLIASLFCINSYGQQDIYKFGEVPADQIEKSIYEIDSTASAIVLFDIGNSYLDSDLQVRYKRHARVKILTDQGLENGEIKIGYRTDSPKQKVNGLKVSTYNLDADGEVQRYEMGKRDYYEEKVTDSWSQVKFTVPQLKAGSIFEYEYEITSESPIDLKGWQFQKEIPVLWSEYSASIPEWFDYMKLVRSFYELHLQEQESFTSHAKISYEVAGNRMHRNVNTRRQTEFITYNGTKFKWAMKDIPALPEEPHTIAAREYSAKVIMQLKSIQFPNSMTEPVLTDWFTLIKLLNESKSFGESLKSNSEFRKVSKNLASSANSTEDVMIKIYDHVAQLMDWNKMYDVFVNDNLEKIYKNGTGNSSEINMILIQLLREAGVEANPVILSTRTNGQLLDIFPIVDQFNHTVAHVQIDSTDYLLDAIHKNRPYNLFPYINENGNGLLIHPQEAAWIPLARNKKARSVDMINMKVGSEGQLIGEMESYYMDYYSYSHKQELNESKLMTSIQKQVFNDVNQLEVDSVRIIEDSNSAFQYKVNFSNDMNLADHDILYLNPLIVKGISNNPFRAEKREYPVDYNLPFSHKIIVNISIPDGWEVNELPESKIVRLPSKLGEFRRIAQINEAGLIYLYSLDINTYSIHPKNYSFLREMYQQMVSASTDQIVFKRIK